MKHLIETTDSSSLATVRYDRIVLDSSTNDVIVRGGGYGYVDLGLPSGLKWATMNVGAETETDYGYYFQWGDIVDKSDSKHGWESYKYCKGSFNTLTKYNKSDGKTTLESTDDAATQIMGEGWRMPTQSEFQELIDNTTKEWTQVNNVNGYKFTSIKEGYQNNSIFIPASGFRSGSSFVSRGTDGFVWSSSVGTSNSNYAWELTFNSDDCFINYGMRCDGLPVRGVRE